MTLVQSLDHQDVLHQLIRVLHVREIVESALDFKPIVRTLASDARYRLRYLESLFLQDEFFGRGAYRKAIRSEVIETFADLGCNVGWFATLLAHETGRRNLRGLMIDANPAMVEKAAWVAQANKLDDVHVLHGLAGAEEDGPCGDFYLLPSNLGSSQFPICEPGQPPRGEWKKVTVPRIDLEETWVERFGDVRCHLLKVDIEGSEKCVFATDSKFLQRVDRVVLEWHKWIISRGELNAMLTARGFELIDVLEECQTSGVAWYRAVRGDSRCE